MTRLEKDYAANDGEVTPGDYVVLAVTDTGIGIPADQIQSVFEPFFTTKDPGRGSGLGLSMVYGFIKQTGGHVRIHSKVGRGTTVRLYLPVDKSGDQRRDVRLAASAADDIGGREVLLVVEDQEEVREITVALLEDLGYRVLQAENGRQALAILEAEGAAIDLIFTDIVMPGGMDGIDLSQAARAMRPGIPVLLSTGYAEAAVLRDGEVKAASNLITKPYHRAELAAKVRLALDEHRAAR